MYIKVTQSGNIYPYALRQLFLDNPNVSFPSSPTESDINAFGCYSVEPTEPPQLNPYTHNLSEDTPELVDGTWKQVWVVSEKTPEEITILKAKLISELLAIRDQKTQTGGFPASGKWFHSDTFSRTQQLGLMMMGQNMPSGIQWKTMDGTFVTMTPALAAEIFASAANQDSAIFAHAETIRSQILASSDISTIDIQIGWPATYIPL